MALNYPNISDIINISNLPLNQLDLKDEITEVLADIYYRDLFVNNNQSNGSILYKFKLLFDKEIKFKFLGLDDFTLSLNNDSDNSITEVDTACVINYGILNYVKDFDLKAFNWSLKSIFNLLLSVSQIDDLQTLRILISLFYFEVENPYEQFVSDLNNKYFFPEPLVANSSLENTVILKDINTQILKGNYSIKDILYEEYIIKEPEKLYNFFSYHTEIYKIEDLTRLLVPQINVGIFDINLSLNIPRRYLIPIDINGDEIEYQQTKVIFSVGSLNFNSQNGLEFDEYLSTSLTKSKITSTGFTLDVIDLRLDLSRNSNIPEAIADGRPDDFIGVYVTEATIGFPESWNHNEDLSTGELKATNLLIGTGGISGTIAIQAKEEEETPLLKLEFGEFEVNLDAFALSFKQNSITQCDVAGKLIFPSNFTNGGNSAVIDVSVSIKDNGDFIITALDTTNALQFKFLDVFTIDILSLSVGRTNDRFFIDTAVNLSFESDQGSSIPLNILPKDIAIKRLRVWDNGSIEFEPQGISLPKAITIPIGPAKINITGIHIGSSKQNGKNYNFFGFDGGVNISPGGVDVRGSGIKFYYCTDNGVSDKFITLDGIGIDIRIPSNAKSAQAADVLIKGYLGISNVDSGEQAAGSGNRNSGTEYAGNVAFSAKALKLQGGASMRYNTAVPAFMVDIGLEFGTPIPLAATGLGIYGFRGLIGRHYIPSKQSAGLTDEDSFWQYYKAKRTADTNPQWNNEGIHAGKFDASKSGNTLGAGVSLATSPDGGRALSTKVFAMLGLPGGLFVQGQANLLSKRIGLLEDNDPPFSALLHIDEKSVTANIGVNYNLPNNTDNGEPSDSVGQILKISALAEMAYFFNDSSAWYFNIGRDLPETARVRARVLSLFDSTAYLMISPRGIKAGAAASFDLKASFGPVSLGVGFAIGIGGFVNFKPTQIGGFLNASGYAYIGVFGFKLGFDVSMGLAAELPKPFIIKGSFRIKINLPWPLDDIGVEVELEWKKDPHKNETPIAPIKIDAATNSFPAKAINILTGETFDIYCFKGTKEVLRDDSKFNNLKDFSNNGFLATKDEFVIPLDSYIDISFEHGVAKNTGLKIIDVTGEKVVTTINVPVDTIRAENAVEHFFSIEDFNIYYYNSSNNSWELYDVYKSNEMLTQLILNADPSVDPERLVPASWQKAEKGLNNRIRVLTNNPFSFTQHATPGSFVLEQRGFNISKIFCGLNEEIQYHLINWLGEEATTVYISDSFLRCFSYTDDLGICLGADYYKIEDTLINLGYLSEYNNSTELNKMFVTDIYYSPLKFNFTKTLNSFNLYTKGAWYGNSALSEYQIDAEIKVYNASDELLQTYYTDTNSEFPFPITYNTHAPTYISKITFEIIKIYLKGGVVKNDGDIYIGDINPSDTGITGLFDTFFDGYIDNLRMYSNKFDEESIYDYLLDEIEPDSTNLLANWELRGNLSPIVNNTTINLDFVCSNSPNFNSNNVYANANSINQLQTEKGNTYIAPHQDLLAFDSGSFSVVVSFLLNTPTTPTYRYQVIIDKRKFVTSTQYYGYILFVYGSRIVLQLCEPNGTTNPVYFEELNLDYDKYYTAFVNVDRAKDKIELYLSDNNGKVFYTSSNFQNVKPAGLSTEIEVYEINYKYQSDFIYKKSRLSQSDINANLLKMKNAINASLQPIWRPETLFAIETKLKDTVNGSSTEFIQTFAFKTRGPVGKFHLNSSKYDSLLSIKSEKEFSLINLLRYVDHDLSYPHSLGELINAKPLFFEAPQLKLKFIENYTRLMFENWKSLPGLNAVTSRIKVIIIEPTNPGTEISAEEGNWKLVDKHIKKPEYNTLNYLVNNIDLNGGIAQVLNCTVTNFGPFNQKSFKLEFVLNNLKPSTLYQAVYILNYNESYQYPLLKYNFTTSKYLNLKTMLDTFVVDDSINGLKRLIKKSIHCEADEVNKIYDILFNDTIEEVLKQKYTTNFDRITQGILNLDINNKPTEGVELNILYSNSNPNKSIGIVIQSNEPFYQFSFITDIYNLITLNFGAVNSGDLKIIYSNDCSKIFITSIEIVSSQKTIALPIGTVGITFNEIDYHTESNNNVVSAPLNTLNFTINTFNNN